MANSYSSSRTTSVSFLRPREKPEVSLDDVAAVVAGLNGKVLQLRREILALRDYPGSERTEGRAGYGNPEVRKTKLAVQEQNERKDENNIARRGKPSSKFIRKKSESRQSGGLPRENEDRSSPTVFLSDDARTNGRHSGQRETRKMSLNREKRRQSLIVPVEREEFNVSGKVTKGTSETSGRILRNNSKNETTQTFVKPKRKSKVSDEVFYEKSTLESSKNRATSSRKHHKYSYKNQDGGSSVEEISSNSEGLRNHNSRRKSMTEHGRSRIVLPSRVSVECEGIRHALGLSTAYCNCDSTGSAVRRVRRKRISRGVQCDQLNDNKYKRSSGLGGCFAFRCCVAKPKKSKQKSLRNSKEVRKSEDSLETYKPRRDKYLKESGGFRDSDTTRNQEIKTTRNHRIAGGAERGLVESRGFEHAETWEPTFFENLNSPQRYRRGTWRKTGREDRWVQKNDVTEVKRRLNECLIELNGIIGDVGYIFKENKQ